MKQRRTTVELTDKERAILWAIAAWFNKKPLVTSSLMQKLYQDGNHELAKRYDDQIYARMIDNGAWLKADLEKNGKL